MSELLFLTGMALVLGLVLAWGFTVLPRERWQMLAIVPMQKQDDDQWSGLNLTYYGFLVASSQLLAVVLLIILLGSVAIPLTGALLTVALLLAVCLPAARLIAQIVEKKQHTFTVGGASFIGILLAPPAIVAATQLLAALGSHDVLPLTPLLAALSICYLLGEGIGRLGCISYGCCYGKPVCQCSAKLQQIIGRHGFVFTGTTRKAVYEGRLAGQPLVPIQAITAIIYTVATIVCCGLFLNGHYGAALIGSILIGQGWRVFSETLRADFRGFAKFSAYQKMGLAAIAYVFVLVSFLPPAVPVEANLTAGINRLWDPGLILGLQGLWLLFFLVFGKSTVTTATISFAVIPEHQ